MVRNIIKFVEKKGESERLLSIKTKDEAELPLIHFAIGNHCSEETILVLSKNGCKLNELDKDGRTSILFAAYSNPDFIPFLLKLGGSIFLFPLFVFFFFLSFIYLFFP